MKLDFFAEFPITVRHAFSNQENPRGCWVFLSNSFSVISNHRSSAGPKWVKKRKTRGFLGYCTPSQSILAQFASARVPFQAPSIFTWRFKPKHWTIRFPSSPPRSHSANVPNRCRDAPSLLGSWVTGEIITAKKTPRPRFTLFR